MTSDFLGSNRKFESNQTRGVGKKCVGTKQLRLKYECEWNWEHYTAFHTVFDVTVLQSTGQLDEMGFDEMGQRGKHNQ